MKIVQKNIDVEPKIGDSIKIIPIIEDLYADTCTIQYSIYGVDGMAIKTERFELTPEQYEGWGYDNSYIENLVLTMLDLEKLED